MLSLMSIVSAVGAGTLTFVAAKKNPEKAPQLRRLGLFFFGFAGLMAVVVGL
ncbi:MAG: hypothetical protein ING59_12055 [Burkholderiales bacterium]|nr:hypothetical protein [Burkholderiales bacterium]